MKTKVTAVLVIALAVCCFFWARSCKSDAALRQSKLEYAGYRAVAEADHEIQQGIIKQSLEVIAQQDTKIGQYIEEINTYHDEITNLSNRLDELQNGEPNQPELETEPLVINLRGQIKTLTDMFSLAKQESEAKDRIILAWQDKYNAQVTISEAWKKQYDNEHALRVMAEDLFKSCEHSRKRSQLWGNVKAVAMGVAAGVAVKVLTK
jgi:hypothetical protein